MKTVESKSQATKALKKVAELKQTIAELDLEMRETQSALLDFLDANDIDKLTASSKTMNAQVVGTVVRGSSITVNQDRLKKAVGSSMWNKISVRVLDKKKLESKMADMSIDLNVVAECTEEKPRKPYVLIKHKPLGKGN